MSKINNPLELYKLLPKTNCKECGAATCLAFAAEVMKNQKSISACTRLESTKIKEIEGNMEKPLTLEDQLRESMILLQKKICQVDLEASAGRLGAVYSDNKLHVKCLGKDFTIDTDGNVSSAIHITPWIVSPLLNYIIDSVGSEPTGKWVPFRELSTASTWSSLFGKRFEQPLKRITDLYPDLIEDMIHVFNGKPVETSFEADISLVLYPLPKIPILICYTKPTVDIGSKLNIFFDTVIEKNLDIHSVYMICVGLIMMFEKIVSRHAQGQSQQNH